MASHPYSRPHNGPDWKTGCSTSAPPNFVLNYACDAGSNDVQNCVKNLATPGIDQSRVTVTTTWPGTTPNCTANCGVCSPTNSQGCLVKVQVGYSFSFMLPLLPKSALNFSGTSEKTIQQ